MNRILAGLTALAGLVGVNGSAAEPFAIDFSVTVGKASKIVHEEAVSPLAKPKDRIILEAKAGNRVRVKWKFVNIEKQATIKDVTIHFFAARVDNASQVTLKKLDKGVLAETALSMDFGPNEQNDGELSFVIDRPGLYLLRVETIGAVAGPAGHEEFAALDVKVK